MDWWKFYGQWLWRAFRHSLGLADLLASLAGSAVAVFAHFEPEAGRAFEPLLWQVPLWAAAAVVTLRLLLAPYWIWREDQAALEALREARDAKQRAREVRDRIGEFLAESIEWLKASRAGDLSDDFEERVNAWFAGVQNYISRELGDSYVRQITNGAGITRYSNKADTALSGPLYTISLRLGELLERLP